ncbi:MAG: autotransporter-associated beta strand repeat-containing protein [Kiritimatiellia bacterium]
MKKHGLSVALVAAAFVASAESITVGAAATVQLDAAKTIDALTLGTDAVLDLNGHDLTLNGTFAPDSANWQCMVTNSAATLATIDITPQHDIRQQFQMVRFGGNLKLVVHANGKLKSNGSFQGVHSSHTGGTVLDAFYYSDRPRFTTSDAFGKGPLTLMNGSQIRLTGSGVTAEFTAVIAGPNDTANENRLNLEKTFTFDGPITVPEGCELLVDVAAAATAYLKGDLSEVRGRIKFAGNSSNIQLQHASGLANAAEVVFMENTQVRWSGDRSTLADETLDVASLETEGMTTNVVFVNTTNAGQITLRVGANNRDTAFYGNLKSDSYPAKDWRLAKVGTGTLTLGRHNSYGGATTISAGAIRLVGEGTLGETSRKANVNFDGGALEIGAGNSSYLNLDCFKAVGENQVAVKVLAGASPQFTDNELKLAEDTVLSNGLALAEGTLTAEPGAELTFKKVWLAPDCRLELNGASIRTGYAALTNDASGIAYVNNADAEHMSTFTAGLNDYAYNSNTKYQFSGNLRYVITGDPPSQINLPDSANAIVNTHTGGTVLSNLTREVRFYGQTSIGNGPIVFYGPAMLSVPSNWLRESADYQNLDHPFEIHGADNTLHLEGPSGGATFKLSGAWTGEGAIQINNGFHPTIELNGDMSQFAGTLALKDEPNSGSAHIWAKGANVGMTNATLKMEATRQNWFSLKPNNGEAFSDGSYPKEYRLGNLVSAFAEPLAASSNVCIRGCIHYQSDFTLRVGYLNQDGTYAGDFAEENDNCTLNLEKVGTGVWTLTGTNTVLKGRLRVSGGQVIAPKGVYAADASTLVSVAETTNTFFPNTLDTTGVAALQTAGRKGDSVPLLTVDGTVVGFPTLTGTICADTAKGVWRLRKTYDSTTGQTTFSADWLPNGCAIIVR